MKRIAVLTSGGDAPGMNAAIRAVVRLGLNAGMEVYGVHRGFEGLIDGDLERMYLRSVGDILHRGGTFLKTARSERFKTEEGRRKAAESLKALDIENLVVIGGNGSLIGALQFSELGFDVQCLPGTIDNDLSYTDLTIGFDTAVNTVLDAITRIRDTSSAHDRITVIEVMGRKCGDIALYSGLAGGAEVVLVPEKECRMEDVLAKVNEGIQSGKQHSIIICAEGYPMSSKEVADYLSGKTGRDIRLVVLSYLQRGGSPTLQDRMFATECGDVAIRNILDVKRNQAIGIRDGSVQSFDLAEALKVEKQFDLRLYEMVDLLSI
ncbi:MAG: 6-phosphofructokinase [Mogibacterium sp.]|nr:6-phosphofructokinase [Mogibacterium sp.]